MIDGPALVLNKSYVPIHITTIKRSICIVFKGLGKFVDEQYQLYDFQSWSELSAHEHDDKIHLTDKAIRVPRIILLQGYDKMPRREVRFSRENVFVRDKSTCQYCGRKLKRNKLNLDHVIPASQGGGSNWQNIVVSCIPCNSSKGGRTPQQAGMKLLHRPVEPKFSLFMHVSPKEKLFDAWKVYMNPVDYAYWNMELEQD